MRILLLGLVTTGLLAGCESGPATAPVSGVVVYRDGKPVTSGVIEFTPGGSGPVARGQLDQSGRFVLRTGKRLGAVPGRHQITIVQAIVADGLPPGHEHRTQTIHARYRRFDTSKLERVVEAGKSNDLRIEVDKASE